MFGGRTKYDGLLHGKHYKPKIQICSMLESETIASPVRILLKRIRTGGEGVGVWRMLKTFALRVRGLKRTIEFD